jgi:hypothetical protein
MLIADDPAERKVSRPAALHRRVAPAAVRELGQTAKRDRDGDNDGDTRRRRRTVLPQPSPGQPPAGWGNFPDIRAGLVREQVAVVSREKRSK